MSKRYAFPSIQGKAKRAKLDITVLDHKFPMSQNKLDELDNDWGDDNEDEMLLLASQACEAYTTQDICTLPDLNLGLQPAFTSTPFEPSTSKFIFKQPGQVSNALGIPETTTKTSPLHGRCTVSSTVNCKEDFIINGDVCKDCGNIYQELLEVKNYNVKLRSENGKLLEKCVTNDGEVSILRSQLKSCQVAVDTARMEKVRAQERVEMEYNQKLIASKNDTRDLRTQLDFKNLEIISLKERCKMLESSKVKLTQVTLAGHDISISQRPHNNTLVASTYQPKKKVATSAVQTNDKKCFIKLNKRFFNETNELKELLPLMLQDSTETYHHLLLHNEKLRKSKDFNQTKCRVFSTLNRVPTTPASNKTCVLVKLSLKGLHKDLCAIASNKGYCEDSRYRYINFYTEIHKILSELLSEMECISQRITTAFRKEMDEKYLDATSSYTNFTLEQVLSDKILYKEEQGILARRAVAILSYVISCEKSAKLYTTFKEADTPTGSVIENNQSFLSLNRICKLFDSSSCAVLYSGFLLSLLSFLERLYKYMHSTGIYKQIIDIIKYIVTSRPMPVVSCKILEVFRKLAVKETVLVDLCLFISGANHTVENNKKDCILQFFLKQIEIGLKCMDIENLTHLVTCTNNLLGLYGNIVKSKPHWLHDHTTNRCECGSVTIQVVVYSLYICSSFLSKINTSEDARQDLESICRCGIHLLYQLMLKDLESTQLGYNEEHYYLFIENCSKHKDNIILDELQGNMLTELLATILSAEDSDISPAQSKHIWIDSFKNFVITD